MPKQCSKSFLHAKCMTVLTKSVYFTQIKDKFPWSYNFCIQSQISANNRSFLHGQSVAWKISSWYTQAEREKFSVFHGATSIIHSLFQLRLTCAYTAVNSSGDLMYCYKEGKKIFQGPKHLIFSGMIKCCFDNHSCVKDWTIMQDRVYTRAKWAHISYCQP